MRGAETEVVAQIRTWQITDDKLRLIDTNLAEQGRREAEHLESWIESEPSILGNDIVLIGRQVRTQSGPLDLLGIDRDGNTVIIELKRDRLPREALVQSIDYASDIAAWTVDRLSNVCKEYCGKSLEDVVADKFEDVESLTINDGQRLLLVGFGTETALERMVAWLSDGFAVPVNAIVLHYTRTSAGEELLTKTVVISEEDERERSKRRSSKIAMSDEPGNYDDDALRELVRDYLDSNLWSATRMKEVLLPACLDHPVVTRQQLTDEFVRRDHADDHVQAGRFISLISSQLSMEKNDYLRQVIEYEYPDYVWQKDNYRIRDGYRDLVRSLVGPESDVSAVPHDHSSTAP